jgi:hypothetical protein
MNKLISGIHLFSIVLLSILSSSLLADNSDLKFQSVVSAVSQTDSTAGTVTVSIHGLDIAVIVNGDTEINESGEEVGLAAVSAGDFVEIDSFLSDQGIVADEINVLDERNEQFRLKGVITATNSLSGSTTITLLGVQIATNTTTKITRRGAGGGSSISASELIVGDTVNARGKLSEGVLVADRIHVGTREPGRIELQGNILSLTDSTISIQLETGGAFDVVFNSDTVINGELVVGNVAEIEGQFNTDISLIAFEIAMDVDGDGDADDDNTRGRKPNDDSSDSDDDLNNDGKVEIGSEIRLKSSDINDNGKVETSYQVENGKVEQEVEVEIEDGTTGTVYSILVFFGDASVEFGRITANNDGEAKLELETGDSDGEQSQLAALIPADLDVRNITKVQILVDDAVILEGSL